MRVLMQSGLQTGLRSGQVDATLEAAQSAMRIADNDPLAALPVAEQAARRAHRERNLIAAAIAERAWGHALLHCGELDDAIKHFRRSSRSANLVGSPALAAEAGLKLAFAVLQRGRPLAALAQIEAALVHLSGASAGRGHAQRAIILHVIGRLDESLDGYETALRILRESADLLGVQRMLINRALVHTDRHAFAEAEQDLREAERLARLLGRELTIGLVANNLGLMQTLRGDVPAALAQLDRAEQIISAHGAQLGTLHQDRTELLLSVGLLAEAEEAAGKAVEAYRREGRLLKVPEARLLSSRVASLAAEREKALHQARVAHRAFRRQGRPEWAALAQLEILRVQADQGVRPRIGAEQLRSMVDTLTQAGWPAAALESRLIAARLARPIGGAEYLLHLRQAGRAAAGNGPAVLRARGWYARAVLRKSSGDGAGALAAARRGLTVLAEHSAAMGATDLRVHASVHRTELVELGLGLSLENGRPEKVFEWAERSRASQLLVRPVRPPNDPQLARLLSDLRVVTAELDRLPPREHGGALRRRQTGLEREVRDRARLSVGGSAVSESLSAGAVEGLVPIEVLGQALVEWALIEFVQLDGDLFALTLVEGRMRLRPLGRLTPVADLTERLSFGLQRLARVDAGPEQQAAAASLLRAAAGRLDDLLLRALPELADRPLVLVPTGPLHSLPWSLLPSCRGRPVTVSPSATLWHTTTHRRPDSSGLTAVVAGPKLAGAEFEARAVAEIYRTTAMSGSVATVEAVLTALSTAGVVHLAAHGRLRSDNPLFSEVLLEDGPLVLYDLESLPQVPHTLVLAACESGRAVVRTGDELLGLSVTFLARGAAQLIASVVPIPDVETSRLMVAFHRRLAAGQAPAKALAQVQQELSQSDPRTVAASAGFICLGSGISSITVQTAQTAQTVQTAQTAQSVQTAQTAQTVQTARE